MGLISPVKFFSLRYDKVFSLKQTLIYNSNLILFKFRGLKFIVSVFRVRVIILYLG